MTREEYHQLVDLVSEDAAVLVGDVKKYVRREYGSGNRRGVALDKMAQRAQLAEFCLSNFMSIECFETLADLMGLDF